MNREIYCLFQSESGDWYGIPENQYDGDSKEYSVASEETRILFESGESGWIPVNLHYIRMTTPIYYASMR